MREHLLMFERFLRSPRTVGAIAPSSRVLARRVVHALDLKGPVRVVELGPGTGAFTGAIAERLDPAGRLLAVDVEPAFVESVRSQWPAIECVCASAEQLETLTTDRGLMPVDHIVSGLPFASLPGATTSRILAGIERSLGLGGTFTTFQYVHAYPLPAAVAFRRQTTERLGGPPSATLVFWNLPPALVLTWRKAN
jgi:phospholipid N-methyltransferase